MSVEKGRHAESLAADHLRERGLTIVTRNFRAPGGEVDLIAMDGPLYVFVEVKSRRAGGGAFAVDAEKAHRVALAATAFLREAGVAPETVRFDIIEVEGEGETVVHHPDAWRA